jgi:hypothetical protein
MWPKKQAFYLLKKKKERKGKPDQANLKPAHALLFFF